jgi:hypothetical protein
VAAVYARHKQAAVAVAARAQNCCCDLIAIPTKSNAKDMSVSINGIV